METSIRSNNAVSEMGKKMPRRFALRGEAVSLRRRRKIQVLPDLLSAVGQISVDLNRFSGSLATL
jgi:hypothetical protein